MTAKNSEKISVVRRAPGKTFWKKFRPYRGSLRYSSNFRKNLLRSSSKFRNLKVFFKFSRHINFSRYITFLVSHKIFRLWPKISRKRCTLCQFECQEIDFVVFSVFAETAFDFSNTLDKPSLWCRFQTNYTSEVKNYFLIKSGWVWSKTWRGAIWNFTGQLGESEKLLRG